MLIKKEIKKEAKKDEVSSIPEEKLVKMPVTNLRAENEFGSIDNLVRRLGSNSIRLLSDHRIIKSAGSMVYGTGCARKMGPFKEGIKDLQSEFDKKQLQKKSDAVLAMMSKSQQFEKKRLNLLNDCKSHGGPFSSPSDVESYVSKCRQEKVPESVIKKALKAEVVYARETLTKRPKTDDVFRIRDRTTNKDLTSNQYQENLVALFSNILAVADVPDEVVHDALVKATQAVGIQFVSSDQPAEDKSADEQNVRTGCLIDSPRQSDSDHFYLERVAFAFLDEEFKKTWCLAMVDCVTEGGYELSLFRPVQGRMGENRVAFHPPDEDHLVTAVPSDILPIPLIITESSLHGEGVFIVNNHEEVDGLLTVAKEF